MATNKPRTSRLLALANQNELDLKNKNNSDNTKANNNNTSLIPEAEIVEEPKVPDSGLKEENKASLQAADMDNKKDENSNNTSNSLKYEDFFKKVDYGVGEQTMKIPIDLHKKFKLLSVHADTPLTQIVSNVLNRFLEEYKKDISKTLKS